MTTTSLPQDDRTPAEKRYDAERDGSTYVRQPDIDDPTVDQELLPEERIILAALADRHLRPADQPFGALADGTTIYGDHDGTPRDGYHRAGCVRVDTAEWGFSVDAETVSGGTHDENTAIAFEGATIAQLQELRAFLNSGAIEYLQAVAVAWGRGDAEPPPAA